ncbi:MAG: hypothetical protein GTO45_29560 [Candidatus Aminicenantes bacterium]|nr:hypothetical protein [Candidatus Aminicenantes bacterium]NIM82941.1 hypothetical protein [Candidatus Aminicenantes bacterium]NIN22318.1 hypothetical protein [Candidatus Aminicenantes bacterium]NIN46086.1 hypothetical protein [Candidatus Aminicenantes bacterium]NIN88922.1 hypothetical protein [Candidatus Aminicenantes bacterium]
MTFKEKLDEVVKERRESLLNKSTAGSLVITYITHYVPLEILAASGSEYLSWEWLVHLYGVPDEYAESQVPDLYFPKDFCAYSRFNFALQLKEPKPQIDRFYLVYTCDPVTKMSEYLDRVYPIHYVNLPRWKSDNSMKLWYNEIHKIKQSLQDLTGSEIGAEKLKNAILTEKRIKKKLIDLCMMRTKLDFPLKSSDLHMLLQLHYLMDQESYEQLLDKTLAYIADNPLESPAGNGLPIVLLLGAPFVEEPPGVLGDTFCGQDIVEFVESFNVKVIEEPWREIISNSMPEPSKYDGDLIEMLANHYYECPLGAYMIPNTDRRVKENLELALLFKAKYALYFNYKGCRVFLAESKASEEALRERGISFQHIQISGEKSEMEQLRTRIESFLYTMNRQPRSK